MITNFWRIWRRWLRNEPPVNNYPHEPERLAHHLARISRSSAVEWERIRNAS